MKMIVLAVAIGLAMIVGSSPGSAETLRLRTSADAIEASSRHRCVCRSHRPQRVVRTYKRYHSSYPHAPWYSADYFPRYRLYHPGFIHVVYRE